jgi:Zn-dependent protease
MFVNHTLTDSNKQNVYIKKSAMILMKQQEFMHIIGAIVLFFVVIAFADVLEGNYAALGFAFVFAAVIIVVNIAGKKLMAYMLDSDVEHRSWTFSQWWWRKHQHFDKPMPSGVIVPLVITLLTGGLVKVMTFLTYETSAKTYKAAKRSGYYSYAEMTDWDNSIIGAAGIVFTLALAVIAYFLPTQLEQLAGLAIGYAFWNMLPVSDLDGTQIFFGSRVLYATLAVITLVFALYAIILV